MSLSNADIERWRGVYEQSMSDTEWVAYQEKRDQRRLQVREEMLTFLDGYLRGDTDSSKFKETYDRKTRHEWDVFGLKGLSGAMFLNMLVKYIPDKLATTQALRQVLAVPPDAESAKPRLRAFADYLNGVIQSQGLDRRKIQPAYAPFFVSSWWHLQEPEQWPIFYVSGRQALAQDGMFTTTGNSVNDYFAFRDTFASLMAALSLKSWELEHLLAWQTERSGKAAEAKPAQSEGAEQHTETEDVGEQELEEPAGTAHTHVQWLLARIGRKLGCQVWIAANDHNKKWGGDRLGDLSIKALPTLGMDADSQKVVGLIDVVWMKGANQVAAAFEIEHTTSIYSGLLRMSDLTVLSPNLNFPLYIVTGQGRIEQVKRELSRPTFQYLELNKRCGFFSSEDLEANFENIMKWAGDPSVMGKLASKVDDVD